MKPYGAWWCLVAMFVAGCATASVPEKTQLQIREFQSRTFEVSDTKMVMKTMLNVLQDDGFIVKNANVELGFLNAMKELDVENKGEVFFLTLFLGASARWKKNSIIEATANVSDVGPRIRVRVNFQVKVMDNRGGVVQVKQIEDEKFYQEFFSKVDKGIFLQKEKVN